MRTNFSNGREACMRLLSWIMPRNSMALVFSSDRETPSSLNVFFKAVMQRSGWEGGKSTTRKSSSRCITKGSLQLFKSIQQSDTWCHQTSAFTYSHFVQQKAL
uniref:Uncharacterized protein n=1 Tax=Anguilla anguilla TaxID=7936 RepID=A0A0E9WNH8_ANGAN